ncbi:hypothetical protein GCM10009835_49390 [Planosporangium flavigriseum]|uniref:Uncharacterized protein n=1 Tax=Planosporangium flavigriseum TaxID=373681 RepID=A0A8J3PN02_9ACTN|nr:hypothetical protein Pfl04_45000 [Planosporangium flavigriseum]
MASAVGTVTVETGIGAVSGYGAAAYYSWQAPIRTGQGGP